MIIKIATAFVFTIFIFTIGVWVNNFRKARKMFEQQTQHKDD